MTITMLFTSYTFLSSDETITMHGATIRQYCVYCWTRLQEQQSILYCEDIQWENDEWLFLAYCKNGRDHLDVKYQLNAYLHQIGKHTNGLCHGGVRSGALAENALFWVHLEPRKCVWWLYFCRILPDIFKMFNSQRTPPDQGLEFDALSTASRQPTFFKRRPIGESTKAAHRRLHF